MVYVGDEAVIKAAGERDATKLREARKNTFLKMIFRQLREDKAKVFVLAETKERLETYINALESDYNAIVITGGDVIPDNSEMDGGLINKINGLEIDVILSEVSSSDKENFVVRNKAVLDVSMWIRTGKMPSYWGDRDKLKKNIIYFFKKYIMLKEIKKENKYDD